MHFMFLNSQKKAAVTGIIVHAVLRNFVSSDCQRAIIKG